LYAELQGDICSALFKKFLRVLMLKPGAVGIILQKKVGDRISKGEVLCVVEYNEQTQLHDALKRLEHAYVIGETCSVKVSLIHHILIGQR
jgi:thymidine phosphorylase